MALAETTLSSACASGDQSIVVAAATSVSAGRMFQIDGEIMRACSNYVSGTTVPVLRGQSGTAVAAHVASARVVHGDGADFTSPVGSVAPFAPAGRVRKVISITATGTCPLPSPGEDLLVVLNGTSVITLTVPVPTKDLDGCELIIAGNGAAAHVLTFTGGLSGASTGYTTVTVNATKPVAFKALAVNEVWLSEIAVPAAGTVTNITGTVA
jgi:hypothetical protein